jgi:hypothetical protein
MMPGALERQPEPEPVEAEPKPVIDWKFRLENPDGTSLACAPDEGMISFRIVDKRLSSGEAWFFSERWAVKSLLQAILEQLD